MMEGETNSYKLSSTFTDIIWHAYKRKREGRREVGVCRL